MKTTIRSKAYLSGAEGQACVHCGVRDDTVVAAHYQGIRAQLFNKGKGTKPHDVVCVADLCRRCHKLFDSYDISGYADQYMKKVDTSEQFLYCCLMTFLRRIEQGIVVIKDVNPKDEA